MKAVFLTNPDDFDSVRAGGVQICSQEYFQVFQNCFPSLRRIDAQGSRHIIDRFQRKFGLKRYLNHNPARRPEVMKQLEHLSPDVVLINHCELLRYAKAIKLTLPNAKIIILSHGNRSGDDLYELTSMNGRFQRNGKTSIVNRLNFGSDVIMEGVYRQRYIDGVVTMSHEEVAIEQWLGSKHTFFFPRIIERNLLTWNPTKDRIGFIGTLNHTPNRIAIQEILNWFRENTVQPPSIRIVGYGEKIGKEFQNHYPFVKYLGELDEENAQTEIGTWSLFLNPIFWLSRGASMKLKKALSWGIPTITTSFGMRGYNLPKGAVIRTKSTVDDFCIEAAKALGQLEKIEKLRQVLEEDSFDQASIKHVSENFMTFMKRISP